MFVRCVLGDDRLGMRLRNCFDGVCPKGIGGVNA